MWKRLRPSSRLALQVVAATMAGWVLLVVGIFGFEQVSLWFGHNQATVGSGPIPAFQAFQMPGIVQPKTVEALQSTLAPHEEVIGFLIGGKARAYRLKSFRDRSRHVVNDLVGGVPLTVAYCDISDCVRAYTDHLGVAPLDVSVAGLLQGKEMIIDVKGTRYFHKTGTPMAEADSSKLLPLERLIPTRTSWEQWKRQHPETDVYEGPPR